MSNALPIEDLSKTYLEHSMVINNFVIKIGSQIKDSLCRVFGDGVQYEWRENDDKVIIPDVSIMVSFGSTYITLKAHNSKRITDNICTKDRLLYGGENCVYYSFFTRSTP